MRFDALRAWLGAFLLAHSLCAVGAPFAYVANFIDDTLSVIDVATNTVVGVPIPTDSLPFGVAVSADGTRVYVSHWSGNVRVFDTATNTQVGADIVVGGALYGIAVNPAGDRVYVANNITDEVAVIDTTTHTVLTNVAVGSSPYDILVDPTGARVYVTNCCSDTVSVIDTATNTLDGVDIAVGNTPIGIAITPDGTRLYVSNENDDNVSVIDTATRLPVAGSPFAVGVGPAGIAVNPAGTRVYVANQGDNTISVIDVASNAVIDTFSSQGVVPQDIAIDPSGSFLYVTNTVSDDVGVFDLSTNAPVTLLPVGVSPIGVGIRPATVPGAPVIGTVTAGNGEATVSFTAPASSGGPAITSYTATCGAFTATGATAPLTVTGLTNGVTYSCSVTATNVIGTGPASATANVTPATVPDAPILVGPVPGNAQATVLFAPPAFDGGSPITSFTATCGAFSASAAASPIVVGGLTNGTTYSCSVVAINAVGTSVASASMNVTPVAPIVLTAPGAPTLVSVAPGNAQAIVTFTPPASNGGSPITGYTASCGAFSASAAGSPITVAGLANGTSYACSVTATNAIGTSIPSATMNVTPAVAAVTTYSAPSATGTGTITASFTGGGPGCTYDSPQFIPAPPGTAPVPPTKPGAGIAFPHGMFSFRTVGCAPGATLVFTITYPSPVEGALYWKYGPTPAVPAPHWYVLPATITGNTAVFSIKDGELGDDDLAANGTIVDQGGPGLGMLAGDVPTLSEWMLMLLAMSMMAIGLRSRARARA